MVNDRPRFFDDLAGVAGGAFSAFTGLYDEAEALMRARVDEALRKLDLVRREDLEAVQEMAANARAGQEAAEARLAALEVRVAALELAAAAPEPTPGGTIIDEL
jgi:BMFP domain-containing protein YqiC